MGFKVSILNGIVNVICEEEVPETDIIDLLTFDENQLEDLYKVHASIQARWEQVSISLKNRYEMFVDDFERKWWAHNKRFAKLVLECQGETKPTVDAIKDMTILIYSSGSTLIERDKHCTYALKSSMKRGDTFTKDQFYNEMFRYILTEPPWYFETLVSTVKTLEMQYETACNISKRLDNRSFHMKELADLVRARMGNIPMSYRDQTREQTLIDEISRSTKNGESK